MDRHTINDIKIQLLTDTIVSELKRKMNIDPDKELIEKIKDQLVKRMIDIHKRFSECTDDSAELDLLLQKISSVFTYMTISITCLDMILLLKDEKK